MPVTINPDHGRMLSNSGPLRKEVIHVTASGTSGSVVSLLPDPYVAVVGGENGSQSGTATASISGKTVSLSNLTDTETYRVEIFQPRSGEAGPTTETGSAGLIQRWKEIGLGRFNREYLYFRAADTGEIGASSHLSVIQFASVYAVSAAIDDLSFLSLTSASRRVSLANPASSSNVLAVVEGSPPSQNTTNPRLDTVLGASGGNILWSYIEELGPFKRQVVYFNGNVSGSFQTDLVNPLYASAAMAQDSGASILSDPLASLSGKTVNLANLNNVPTRVVVEGF